MQQEKTATAIAAHLQLPVWRTITIGTGLRTADDFRHALTSAGYRIGTWANDILGKPAFTAAAAESPLDLVVASVAELGFRNGATTADIYARAKSFGLELCPAEVGPQLRLQYADQPYGEWLFIAMEPISDSVGYPFIFDVERDGYGRWLHGGFGDPDNFWLGLNRFAFVRRN